MKLLQKISGGGSRLRVGVLALQGDVIEHARMLESLEAEVVLVRHEHDLSGPDGLRVDAVVLPGGESSTQDRLLRLLDLQEPLGRVLSSEVPVLGTCAGMILIARDVLDPAPGQTSFGALDIAVRRNALGSQIASIEAEFQVVASESPGVAMRGKSDTGAVRGTLIRAPEIVEIGHNARVIVTLDGRLLGATSVNKTDLEGTADSAALTHPETAECSHTCDSAHLTDDSPESSVPADSANTRGGSIDAWSDPMLLGRVTGISFHPELSGDPAFHRALLAQARHRQSRRS